MNKKTSTSTNDESPPTAEALDRRQVRATAGQFALEVMHELKNPLEALGNLTYLAQEESADPEKVRKYMGMAEEQMATLHHIVSQTLGFASSSHVTRQGDLVALAEAALRIHDRRIKDQKVRLIKELPSDLVAEVHTGEILQVISNLVVNALDALPNDGTLSVRMCKRQGEIHLVVADNGGGIKAEHIGNIFEPFFTTKEQRGTGLGLALSKRIIERHHGRIRVRSSVHPDRHGTAFKICLPWSSSAA